MRMLFEAGVNRTSAYSSVVISRVTTVASDQKSLANVSHNHTYSKLDRDST